MINGIINVYKEKGYTSHDVVGKLRSILGQKKIGHAGTLDPDAEGVLPVLLGKATKACDFLTGCDKTYETVMLLGRTTDTQDISGKVLEEKDTSGLDEETIRQAIKGYAGVYEQLPPMYSALRVNGKRLYESAREGKDVERRARPVVIYAIKISCIRLPRVGMEVNCSKGTYIRTLCHDIGKTAGCGGCMESLVRTRVGRFSLKDSIKLAKAREYKDNGTFMEYVLPVDRVFEKFPAVYFSEEQDKAAHNGNPVGAAGLGAAGFEKVRAYDSSGRFIGIYCFDKGAGLLKPEKMFFDAQEPAQKKSRG